MKKLLILLEVFDLIFHFQEIQLLIQFATIIDRLSLDIIMTS